MIDLKNMSENELRNRLGHSIFAYSVGPIESPTPYEIFEELARRLREQESQLLGWKKIAEDWMSAARESQQPPDFYKEYSEKTMNAMQALMTKAKERAEQAEASLEQMTAKCAVMVASLQAIKSLDGNYSASPETALQAILLAEQAFYNLPTSVSKMLAIQRAAEEESFRHREFDDFTGTYNLCACDLCLAFRANREKP